jgi:hypothetical protein
MLKNYTLIEYNIIYVMIFFNNFFKSLNLIFKLFEF